MFDVPAGGLTLWVRAEGIDVEAWRERAERAGVLIQSGRGFSFDGSRVPCVRLGFAAGTPRELSQAVELLAAAVWEDRDRIGRDELRLFDERRGNLLAQILLQFAGSLSSRGGIARVHW